MPDKTGIIAAIEIWEDGVTRSAGDYRFAVIPRTGEKIIVEHQNNEIFLKVREVTHFGESIDPPQRRLQMLKVVEVHVTCEKL